MRRDRAQIMADMHAWLAWLDAHGLAADDALFEYAMEQQLLGLPPPSNVEAWKHNAAVRSRRIA